MSKQPETIYLKDYKVPPFLIDQVQLHFDLLEAETQVRSILNIRRNPASLEKDAPLRLNGEALKLLDIYLDHQPLQSNRYRTDEAFLTIDQVPESFVLETVVSIDPKNNTHLSGLYQSNGNYCTQCEAEGFRRITYFLDRPDVMSRFRVAISADRGRYPTLLSNGNLIEERELPDQRHWVLWEDPSLKPCYLFALVAGDYEHLEKEYRTGSGRKVSLYLYLEKGNLHQGDFALGALERSMRWDEEHYGREYDLDQYMIVAVGDFNMGAMENKGLNIFNTKYILANSQTATDLDYMAIENVVGHEYFHNWTGNRVTCRDWFQITLKEGLTVFRDQSFSADMNSPLLNRINAVNLIRNLQFPQDAGPMAHPIRPDQYLQIDNFYTVTVYNKGAEVIRMVHTLIGAENFRKGMDLYFQRFDGHAVTTDDFIQSMEDASGKDLTQFRRWYSQSGTPVLEVESEYDAAKKTYTLTVKQSCAPTIGQDQKLPFHLPLKVSLLNKAGEALSLRLLGELEAITHVRVLELKEPMHQFVFEGIDEPVTPSLLRNFSAPVILKYPYTQSELIWLMAHETDAFNRWDSAQRVATDLILKGVKLYQEKTELKVEVSWLESMQKLLKDSEQDRLLVEKCLTLPTENYCSQQMEVIDIEAIHEVREWTKWNLASSMESEFLNVYQQLNSHSPYEYNVQSMGERSLKNISLSYLNVLKKKEHYQLALKQFRAADNMTDKIGALIALNDHDCEERIEAMEEFYQAWKHEPLVVDKWLILEASSSLPDTLERVKALLTHSAFDLKNPNKVRSLIGIFSNNLLHFHASNGGGYRFLSDQVLSIDPANPQLAARIVEPLSRWQHFDEGRQQLMRHELERIIASPKLSKNVYEIVARGLKSTV